MVIALVKRILIQTVRDKRTLALMMIAPLIIMTLINFLFNSSDSDNLRVGVYNIQDEFKSDLEDQDITVLDYCDNNELKDKIKDDKLNAFIEEDEDTLEVTYNNIDTTYVSQLKIKIQKVLSEQKMSESKEKMSDISSKLSKINPNLVNEDNVQSEIVVQDNYLYGDEDLSYFDTLNPILIGFFVFFFVFLISGISILKERTTKTIEKLLATPIKRWQIILGYLLGYGIFAVVQTIVIVCYSIYVLNINVYGNIMLVILTNVLIAFVALSLGILLSTFADSEFQMMQFIPIIIVPQIFFTGMISIDSLHPVMQKIAYAIPLFYGGQALQGIMIKSYGISDIWMQLLVLLCMTIGISILNIIGLRKYRKA